MADTIYINNDILQERAELFLANLADYRKALAGDEKNCSRSFNRIADIDRLSGAFRSVFHRPREGTLIDALCALQKNYIEQAYRLPFTSEGRDRIIDRCSHKLVHRTGDTIDRAKDRLESIGVVHNYAIAAQLMAVEMGRVEHKPLAEGNVRDVMGRVKVFLDKGQGNNIFSFPKKDCSSLRKG